MKEKLNLRTLHLLMTNISYLNVDVLHVSLLARIKVNSLHVSKQVSEVDKIKIDGYFDSSSKHRKCDYLFVYTPTSPSNCIYIFVELKGTDIAHAVTQIGNTVNLFYNQGYLKDKKVIGAIVSSRHPSNDGTYRKAKQTLEKSLSSKIKDFRIEKKNREMTYDPTHDKVI